MSSDKSHFIRKISKHPAWEVSIFTLISQKEKWKHGHKIAHWSQTFNPSLGSSKEEFCAASPGSACSCCIAHCLSPADAAVLPQEAHIGRRHLQTHRRQLRRALQSRGLSPLKFRLELKLITWGLQQRALGKDAGGAAYLYRGVILIDEMVLDELYRQRALPHATSSHHHQLVLGHLPADPSSGPPGAPRPARRDTATTSGEQGAQMGGWERQRGWGCVWFSRGFAVATKFLLHGILQHCPGLSSQALNTARNGENVGCPKGQGLFLFSPSSTPTTLEIWPEKNTICFVLSRRAVPPGSAAFYDPIPWGLRHEMTSPTTRGLVYSYSEELQHPELFNLIPSLRNEGYFKMGKEINQSQHKNMPSASPLVLCNPSA